MTEVQDLLADLQFAANNDAKRIASLEDRVAKLEREFDDAENEHEAALEAAENERPDPCRDGFHYIAQYGPSGGIGQCKYCGAPDDGTIINYATLDPMAFPMPAPMRKSHGRQLVLPCQKRPDPAFMDAGTHPPPVRHAP
jgi:hypothetical protein